MGDLEDFAKDIEIDGAWFERETDLFQIFHGDFFKRPIYAVKFLIYSALFSNYKRRVYDVKRNGRV